jgi:hypothetical protein
LTRGAGRTERSYTKETKINGLRIKLKTTSQKRALAEPFALQAHFNAARCRFFSLFFTLFPERPTRQEVSILFLLRQFGFQPRVVCWRCTKNPPKKVPESKDESSGLAFSAQRASRKSINTS